MQTSPHADAIVFIKPKRTWVRKFADSFRGIAVGIRGESSFGVHIPLAIAVIGAGIYYDVTATEWCLLALCISSVLTAELLNSALELTVQAVEPHSNPLLRDALDISSGAVFVISIGAATVGAIIFLPRLI